MPNPSEILKIDEFFTAEKAGSMNPEVNAGGELVRLYAEQLIMGASGETIARSKDGRTLLAEMLASSLSADGFEKQVEAIKIRKSGGEGKMATVLRPSTPSEFDQEEQLEITKQ